jgi:hypothetical protein
MVPVSRADVTEKAGGAGGESHRLRGWWFFCGCGAESGQRKAGSCGAAAGVGEWVEGRA